MRRRDNTTVAEQPFGGRLPLLLLALALGLALAAGVVSGGQGRTAHAGAVPPICIRGIPGELGTAGPPICPPIDPCAPLGPVGIFDVAGGIGLPPECNPVVITPGTLTVTKVVSGGPAAPSDFGFVVTAGAAPVSGVQSPAAGTDSTSFQIAFNAVVSVEEVTTAANYVADESNCTNISVGLGLDVACTITNTYVPPPGSLTIVKATSEPTTETFDFTSSLGNFTLGNTGSQFFGELGPGSYSVTESALPTGWILQSAVCDRADAGTLVQNTLTVNLGLGEDVTCTFTNQAPAAETPPVSDPNPPIVDTSNPAIDLETTLNEQNSGATLATFDAGLRSAQALQVAAGSTIFWTFRVENTGDVVLTNVFVTNDAGTPTDPSDDLLIVSGLSLTPGQVIIRTVDHVALLGSQTTTSSAFGTGGSTPQTVSDFVVVTYEGVTGSGGAAGGAAGGAGDGDSGGDAGTTPDAPAALPNAGSGGIAGFGSDAWDLLLAVPLIVVSVAYWSRRRRSPGRSSHAGAATARRQSGAIATTVAPEDSAATVARRLRYRPPRW